MKISLISLFLLAAVSLHAQQFLYVKKFRTSKRDRIERFDRLKVKAHDSIFKGLLYQVGPDFIAVDDRVIMLDDIEWIRTIHPFWRGMGYSLKIGTALFSGIILVNGALNGWSPIFTQASIIALSSVFVAGLILDLIAIRTYRKSKGWIYEPLIMDDL